MVWHKSKEEQRAERAEIKKQSRSKTVPEQEPELVDAGDASDDEPEPEKKTNRSKRRR